MSAIKGCSVDRPESAEECKQWKQIYRDLVEICGPDGIADWGNGPMVYMADGMWVCKNGDTVEEEDRD